MKRTLILVLVVSLSVVSLAFAAGYFLGGSQAKESLAKSLMTAHLDQTHRDHTQELGLIVLILTQFREGKTADGTDMLEKWLDGSLLVAVSSGKALNNSQDATPGFVQEVRDYRVKFPWTNSTPEIHAKVEKILSLAN